MYWIEILRNVKYQVADKDIEVYKIVTLANKQSCVSIIKNFNYTANILYKISTLECKLEGMGRLRQKKLIIVILEYNLYVILPFTQSRGYIDANV